MQPFLILLSTLLASSGGNPPQVAETAIVGARLEIGDGRVVENGTLVMRGDKIVLLGEGLPAPAGSTVVDGKGLTVYPGFVDCYSTSGLKMPEPLPQRSGHPGHPPTPRPPRCGTRTERESAPT